MSVMLTDNTDLWCDLSVMSTDNTALWCDMSVMSTDNTALWCDMLVKSTDNTALWCDMSVMSTDNTALWCGISVKLTDNTAFWWDMLLASSMDKLQISCFPVLSLVYLTNILLYYYQLITTSCSIGLCPSQSRWTLTIPLRFTNNLDCYLIAQLCRIKTMWQWDTCVCLPCPCFTRLNVIY